jgi:hypothetical protein
MFMLIKNVEKPKLPKLVWALRKQFGPETLIFTEKFVFIPPKRLRIYIELIIT